MISFACSLREDEPVGHNGSAFFSPLHIPDEEAVGLADGLTAPSSPTPSITDLASDVTSPVYVFVFAGPSVCIEDVSFSVH